VKLLDLGPAHAPAMAALHSRGFDQPWDAASFETFLKLPTYRAFGWGSEQTLAGFALFNAIPPELELCTLVVDPNLRRQGIARALLLESFEALSPFDVCFLEVAEHNKAARVFYQSLDFVETGRRPNYYLRMNGSFQDAVLMRLNDFKSRIE